MSETVNQSPARLVQLPLVDSTGWGRELIEKFESGVAHAFILHGNVEDYVGGEIGEPLVAALLKRFAKNREVAVGYDRANGFYFPTPDQKDNFKLASGIEEELAALRGNALGGGGGSMAGGLAAAFNNTRNRASSAESDAVLEKIAASPAAALGRIGKLLRYVQPQPANTNANATPTTSAPTSSASGSGSSGRSNSGSAVGSGSNSRTGSSSSSSSNTGANAPAAAGGTAMLLTPNAQPVFRSAVILHYAETIAPAGGTGGVNASETDRNCLVSLQEIGKDLSIAGKGNLIILIVSDLGSLHEQLRRSGSRWEQIEIPFPTTEERQNLAEQILADPSCAVQLETGFSTRELARMTTGLRFIDVDDIILRAEYEGDTLTREHVKNRKQEIVAAEYDDVLQIVEGDFGFEVLGGMDEIKAVLLNDVVAPMRAGDYQLVPQGALLMGPPGTGKSRIARALAKEAGFTFVELQPSKIFDKWVGSTEQRLARAMRAIKSMSPVLVFMDEVDQIGQRNEGGDSGVSGRVFKQLLETMADTTLRGRVFWFGATNKPENLDAALLRPGRLDLKIPVLVPNATERASILEVLTTKVFNFTSTAGAGRAASSNKTDTTIKTSNRPTLPTAADYQSLADLMEGEDYTGAEIESVVIKASRLWLAANRRSPKTVIKCLEEAYELIIPSTPDVESMTHQALLHCSDLELVPVEYRELARQIRRRKQKAVQTQSANAGSDQSQSQPAQPETARRGRRREL